MRTQYQVHVYDPDTGSLTRVLTRFRSLEVEGILNRPDVIRLNKRDDGDDPFQLDAVVKIRRRPTGHAWVDLVTAFHRGVQRSMDSRGDREYAAYQAGLLDLLMRRIVMGYKSTAYTYKNKVGETVFKELVREQAVEGEVARSLLGLSVETDKGGGNMVEIAAEWEVLLEVLYQYAEDAGGDYDVVMAGANEFMFRWHDKRLGKDRTTGNASGNDPVVFSTAHRNLRNPVLMDSRLDEVNAYVVGGAGRGVNRMIVAVHDEQATELSPWNRIEGFINAASDGDDSSQLARIGRAELNKTVPEVEMQLDVVQTPTSVFGVHYMLGDYVTTYVFGERRDKKIVSYRLSVDVRGEEVTLGFADVAR